MRKSWLLALLLTACSTWTVPVVPPAPPPQPAPVDPVPVPVPPAPVTTVATYAAVSSLTPGWTLAQATGALGFPPLLTGRQDTGETIARWPCVNANGEPRWCDVLFDRAGALVGHALLPRTP